MTEITPGAEPASGETASQSPPVVCVVHLKPVTVLVTAICCAATEGVPEGAEKVSDVGATMKEGAATSTLRMRSLPLSARHTFPAGSMLIPAGLEIPAALDGPPSPATRSPLPPMSVLMIPSAVTRAHHAKQLRDVEVAGSVRGHPRRLLSSALVARPPLPDEPKTPVPATVVIVPSRLTLRTRLFCRSAM